MGGHSLQLSDRIVKTRFPSRADGDATSFLDQGKGAREPESTTRPGDDGDGVGEGKIHSVVLLSEGVVAGQRRRDAKSFNDQSKGKYSTLNRFLARKSRSAAATCGVKNPITAFSTGLRFAKTPPARGP